MRSVPSGESDVIATFFTEAEGILSAVVRGARRSTKRFGGALEPIHELAIVVEDRGKELCSLREARIGRVRLGIVANLAALEVAGKALRWVRHACSPRTPERDVWDSLRALLDALDLRDELVRPTAHLAAFGFELLQEVGYGMDLRACLRCGKECPPGRSAFLDTSASGGGLVCMRCGGARRTIRAEVRMLAVRAQERAPSAPMTPAQASELVQIVEEAMNAHADFDPHARK